jgi:MFS family permease
MKLSLMLRALRYRNYRLFFVGQGISLIGTWMEAIAMGWLVYRLTNSAFMLGAVGFMSQMPSFLLTPFAGVYVDRLDRRSIMIGAQTLSMMQAFALAALVLTGKIEVWHIIALSLLLGLINAFDAPARQAFVLEMIDTREDLGNAIALNSIMFNGARLIGPSIAGVVIAAAGEGVCFLANGVSFIAVIAALLAMRMRPSVPVERHANILHGLKEGIVYALGSLPIRLILLLLGLVSVVGMPYGVLMPVFATDILKGGPQIFGFLMSASGVGALTGAAYLAARKTVVGLGRQIAIASGILGLGLVAFSLSRSLALSMVFLFFVGFGMIVHAASSNTVLQMVVDDDKRGRVMSFYTMAFMGMMPFGSLLAGTLASRIGAPATMLAGGVSCIAGSLAFAVRLPYLRREIRPIYRKKGIIAEAASGLEAVDEILVPPED